MKNILLTFTGFHDPYSTGLIGEEEHPGPILSLLNNQTFDKIFLFSTPNTIINTEETNAVISANFSNVITEIKEIALADPTNYVEIFAGIRSNFSRIDELNPSANYFISLASGTPQMQTCWLLLVASGEIPAKLLQVRPPKFVTRDVPPVIEIDINLPEFPDIRSKPINLTVDHAEICNIEKAISELKIVGDHSSMRKAFEIAAALASTDSPIIIQGETGTGKELFARLIHRISNRNNMSFIPINCAAIPNELVESILFGHKKGAFTGAISDQAGKFELADTGTLFLDELAELPLLMQAKLLRVLQDGIIEPIGCNKTKTVNVRIIAATNKDLKKLVRENKFREDLYYRLNVGEICLPPLRKRRSDIPKIALFILDKINKNLRYPKQLSTDALVRLLNHDWHGNVRDLSNVLERSARLCHKQIMNADDILIGEPIETQDPFNAIPDLFAGFNSEDFLKSIRKQLFLKALDLANGNQSKAAELLGLTPQAVHKFLQSN
jgi:DNA-binding NtrC family response regulator